MKRLECDYAGCPKSYCSSFNLKRHIEIVHLGIKKFRCNLCGKFMSSKQNLIDHEHIHTGAKPYVCEVQGCGHPFRQLSQYYLHRQLHNEVATHINRVNYVSEEIIEELTKRIPEKLNEDFQEYRKNCLETPELCVLPPIGPQSEFGLLPSILEKFGTV